MYANNQREPVPPWLFFSYTQLKSSLGRLPVNPIRGRHTDLPLPHKEGAAPAGAPQWANKTSLPDRDLLRNTAAPRRGLRLL